MSYDNWNPSRPVCIEGIVRPYMVKKAMGNDRRYDIFHPSAWGQCLRKVAYQYYNQAEPFLAKNAQDIDPRMERIFDTGHSAHARWQNYLDCAGILRGCWKCPNPLCGCLYGAEDPIGILNPARTVPGWKCKCGNGAKLVYEEISIKSPDQYNFRGHVDAVVDLRGTEYERHTQYDVFIADMKTIKDDMFSELTEPKTEHVVQVNIYMWILGLNGAVVVYENKDNQSVKEMFVPKDEALIEKIKQQSLWMRELLESRKLPSRPSDFTRSKFPCRMCEFLEFCYRAK
jgi:CRISPR/Cas system-associated exonuclease Cas4 (RecB family)